MKNKYCIDCGKKLKGFYATRCSLCANRKTGSGKFPKKPTKITVEDVRKNVVFQLAFQEMEERGLLDIKDWESLFFDLAKRISSKLAKERLYKGVGFSKSPYKK